MVIDFTHEEVLILCHDVEKEIARGESALKGAAESGLDKEIPEATKAVNVIIDAYKKLRDKIYDAMKVEVETLAKKVLEKEDGKDKDGE